MSTTNRLPGAARLARVRRALGAGIILGLACSVTITCMRAAPAGAEIGGRPEPNLPAPAPVASEESKEPSKPCPRSGGRGRKSALVLDGVLNLNTAAERELLMLPGVGPSKAKRILRWRARHKRFRRARDLRRVKGFGYKTFKKLRKYITVTGPTTIGLRPLRPAARAALRNVPPPPAGASARRD